MTQIFTRSWTSRTGELKTSYRVKFLVNGKHKFRQFPKHKLAKAFVESLAITRPEMERAAKATKGPTVNVVAKEWLVACEAGRDGAVPLESATLVGYQGYVTNYIKPALGTRPIASLRRTDVVRFRDDLLDAGISRSTAKRILGALKSICGYALSVEVIDQDPTNGITIKAGARHRPTIEVPSKRTVRRILDYAQGQTQVVDQRVANAWRVYYPFLLLLVGTGIRLSEARGLPRESVQFSAEGARIFITQRADRTGKIGPPKSARGRRSIYLPHEVVEVLQAHLLTHNRTLVFGSRNDTPLCPQNLQKRMWTPLAQALGLKCTMHHLRHHFASRLIEAGQNVKEVAAVLGHADEAFTLRTYGHLFKDGAAESRRRQMAQQVLPPA